MPSDQDALFQYQLELGQAGTVGSYLDKISREARTTTEKGQALEFLFRDIATSDPALEIEEIDLYRDWAIARNDPRFSTQDKGIDLVARRTDGTYAGIQCKFYDSRRRISKTDINSFLAKLATGNPDGTPFFSQGLIVSTTRLADGLEEELGPHACDIRFLPISKYSHMSLKTGFQFEKREPRPYQVEAIEQIENALPQLGRGKLIMACGTGKTFTALRAMERMVPAGGRVLVCAPTIALVSQIRAEWLRQTNRRLHARVVCSDAGAGRTRTKESLLAIQELECPVTTSADRLAAFLKDDSPGGIKVVITTYHSLIRVKDAQQDAEVPDFDLAIADEAHKTTGSSKKLPPGSQELAELKSFQLIHDAASIRARMRLYMTATPRVYSNSDALETKGYDVTDMDDTDVYGNTLYQYDFKTAVEDGHLCDYRLIMLGVHQDVLTPKLRAMVRQDDAGDVSYDEMTRVFGTMLAVRGNSSTHAGARTGILHRTIAFANSVARSQWYSDTINSPDMKAAVTRSEKRLAVAPPPPPLPGARTEIVCSHLDARDPVITRIAELQQLEDARKHNRARILCNVGLFSEGIDVPSLNSVAFLDSRKSAIDIVQAVGRVMRRPAQREDKKMGYVIVPVVVPEGSSLDEAFTATPEKYRPVLDVIRALQSHDETLAETLKSKLVIHDVRPDRAGLGDDDDAIREDDAEDPASQLNLDLSDSDRRGIIAFIVKKTGLTPESKGALVAKGITSWVEGATARMLQTGIGPELGRLLSVSENRKTKTGWREACTLGALLVLNALLVHQRIQGAAWAKKVHMLHDVLPSDDPALALDESWTFILRKDYRAIFDPALSVLEVLREWPGLCRSVLQDLVECAVTFGPDVSSMGWDHAGPLYHSVLGTAKSDGAFYTNNLSALLLARLAIHDDMADWTDPASIAKLRIMDPACGTGTLLMAVLQELKRRAREANPDVDLNALHKQLVENSIAGLDINRHATQLAASNLTISSDDIDYDRMHLYTVKRGVQDDGTTKAGSLEILDTVGSRSVRQDLLQDERSITGVGARRSVGIQGDEHVHFQVENIDLAIMNPPFTNAEDKGGSLPTEDKKKLTLREKGIVKNIEKRDPTLKGVTNFNSLETFFTPLSDLLVRKDEGSLAQVMPATACTGSMATEKRRWIAARWHVERIVSNHDPDKYMFSENTSIHEVLMICRRTLDPYSERHTEHVSLIRHPENEKEAHECIEAILRGSRKERAIWFTRIRISADRIAAGDWRFVQWHQPELETAVQALEAHSALEPLGGISSMGRQGRQARGTWEKCEKWEAAAWSFWSKSEALRQTIKDAPEQPVKPKKGKYLKWSRENGMASNLLVANGGRTDSGRVMAAYAENPTFGSGWQPVLLEDESAEPAMAGWLNSTPGRLLFLNRRASNLIFPQYSVEDISSIPVPKDLRPLDEAVRSCWRQVMKPGRDSSDCEVRTVLDEAAARILGVPASEVARWRRLLAQEPTVSGKPAPIDGPQRV